MAFADGPRPCAPRPSAAFWSRRRRPPQVSITHPGTQIASARRTHQPDVQAPKAARRTRWGPSASLGQPLDAYT